MTKPAHSLGQLERIAEQLAAIAGCCPPPIPRSPAARHGGHRPPVDPPAPTAPLDALEPPGPDTDTQVLAAIGFGGGRFLLGTEYAPFLAAVIAWMVATTTGRDILTGTPEEAVTALGATETGAAVLTGDALFIGDVGRPDLLTSAGRSADSLARDLYRSLHEQLLPLPDATLVYPAHGAGSACGKNLSTERWSTCAG